MLKVNDKIKVHMYGTDGKEIQTRNMGTVYTVREENGKKYHWSNTNNGIVEMERCDEYEQLEKICW